MKPTRIFQNDHSSSCRYECRCEPGAWCSSPQHAEVTWRAGVRVAANAKNGGAPVLCPSTNYGRFSAAHERWIAARGFSAASDAKPGDAGGDPYGAALVDTIHELRAAAGKFPRFNSGHEGYAVLLEEVRELEREVFRKDVDPKAVRKEAKQVAAMALRFIGDVCDRYERACAGDGPWVR